MAPEISFPASKLGLTTGFVLLWYFYIEFSLLYLLYHFVFCEETGNIVKFWWMLAVISGLSASGFSWGHGFANRVVFQECNPNSSEGMFFLNLYELPYKTVKTKILSIKRITSICHVQHIDLNRNRSILYVHIPTDKLLRRRGLLFEIFVVWHFASFISEKNIYSVIKGEMLDQ
jgi:hypothetical protein